ncbi:MAG: tRNA (adenosine(37)-N6)-threonylcarbamoyltransferase complex dimerization subunit type 1 TsaB, partial [Sphingomicrobium sp.]
TGIRVGIAAAHGLAIGWGIEIAGMSSLALLAAGAGVPVGVAVQGGHGELFVEQFDDLACPTPMLNCTPAAAAKLITSDVIVGSGAVALVDARGAGQARDALPSALNALRVPESLRTLAPKPLYARAPDARAKEAA